MEVVVVVVEAAFLELGVEDDFKLSCLDAVFSSGFSTEEDGVEEEEVFCFFFLGSCGLSSCSCCCFSNS